MSRCNTPPGPAHPGTLDGDSHGTYGVGTKILRVGWDSRKSLANLTKHGVSFPEAQTAFHDENAKVYFDSDHSEAGDRFIFPGMSYNFRVLVACHCFRGPETLVRILSARKADRSEQRDYWG